MIGWRHGVDTHVMPLEDLIVHEATRQCLCRPHLVELTATDTMVVHHSYDGREYWEEDYEPEPPNA